MNARVLPLWNGAERNSRKASVKKTPHWQSFKTKNPVSKFLLTGFLYARAKDTEFLFDQFVSRMLAAKGVINNA